MKKKNSFKIILLFAGILLAFISGCKKDDTGKPLSERFQLVEAQSAVKGNLIEGTALSTGNVLSIAYINAPANATAKISAEAVNGIYLDESTVSLSGSSSIELPLKGKPETDGTFTLMVRVNVDGTVYIFSKEIYVDIPNITEITFGLPEAPVFNVNAAKLVDFEIYPKSTEFTIVDPTGVVSTIVNTSPTGRTITFTPTSQFIAGEVIITATYANLPPVVKKIKVTAFSNGDGTTAAPYEVADADRLNRVQYGLSNAFKLTADITQTTSTTTGSVFAGVLDGNGKKISNCTIAAKSGYFAEIASTGVVKNITFENLTLTGSDKVGGVAGINRGTISGVTLSGSVTGGNYVGGIAGDNFGTITTSTVTSLSVSGVNNIATLAGHVNSGSSQASNVVLVAPDTFPVTVYGISSVKIVDFTFAPSDGTIAIKSVPTNLTASASGQKVTLSPASGFVSGDIQIALKKDLLSAIRTVKVFSKVEGSIFDAGDGSLTSPYLISTADALEFVKNEPTKNYKITADITLSNVWTPIPSFTGSIDGQGFKVSNLTINSTTANQGWISTLTGTGATTTTGIIKNIRFLNVNCTTNSAFGVITGKNDGGLIQNVVVSGSVTSTNTGDVLGGVAGELLGGGKITQCYTKLAMVSSCGMTGGIVGRLTTATGKVSEISLCTSTGTMDINAAKNRIAGILGRAEGSVVGGGVITKCLSSIAITSSGPSAPNVNGVGGIFGADQNAGIVPIDQCMFNGTISSGFSIGGIAGVGSTITNCIVVGQGVDPANPTLKSTGTPATGNVGGIAGTNKVKLVNCVVKNVALKGAGTTAAMPVAGISSTYQNNGYAANNFVANTSLEGSATGSDFVYRISGTAGNGTGVNSSNYVGPNVTAALRTNPFVNDAAGLDGALTAVTTQAFFQTTLGFDFGIWKMDTDGYPTLQKVGYSGGLTTP